MTESELIAAVAGLLRADERTKAGAMVADFAGQPKAVHNDADANTFLKGLLQNLLDEARYEDAAFLCWGDDLFTSKPRCTQMVWRNMRESSFLLIQGGSSMSKSYAAGVWLLLDWARDPEFTTVKVVGPSENHLEDNLFSHLVNLHKNSAIPLPGEVGKLFIGLDLRNRTSSITGVVIPQGKTSGKLQGVKRKPRKKPHPVFGRLTRLRVFIDELELVPPGVLKDIDNLRSNYDGRPGGLLVAAAYNPVDIGGAAGQRAEPEGGWASFDIDKDEEWVSKRKWKVVRLDPAKSENVLEQRVVFEGLHSYEAHKSLIESSGGTESASYYTFGRGAFPLSGTALSVIPQLTLDRSVGEFLWRETPQVAVGVDIALEGGDTAKFTHGVHGFAVGVRLAPSLLNPLGETRMFGRPGAPLVKYCCQINSIIPLPKAETVAMAQEIVRVCRVLGVSPDAVTLDRTGNGAGVHDLVKKIWSEAVRGVNFSESATGGKILEEDQTTAEKGVAGMVSELWIALRKWMDYGRVMFNPAVSLDKLSAQLTGRHYRIGKKDAVESKREYTSRNNPSPDDADSVTLFLNSVRRVSGHVPALSGDEVAGVVPDRQPVDSTPVDASGTMIDPTNLMNGLNDAEGMEGTPGSWAGEDF